MWSRIICPPWATYPTSNCPNRAKAFLKGGGCAKLFTADGRTYSLWCPLSGRVLTLNTEVMENPARLTEKSRDLWLIKIDPTAIEHEIENLL